MAGAVSGMALVVAKGITEFPSNVKLSGYLDVYWIVRDGGLCLLITFLLRQSKVWRHCKIRIVAVARQQENSTKLKQQLQNYVYQLRIDAEILVALKRKSKEFCHFRSPNLAIQNFPKQRLSEHF